MALQVNTKVECPKVGGNMYTVQLLVSNNSSPLDASFEIFTTAGAPVRWQILFCGTAHEGISVGEKSELQSKLKGKVK